MRVGETDGARAVIGRRKNAWANGGNGGIGGGADKASATELVRPMGVSARIDRRVAQGGVAGRSTKKRRTRAVFQFAGHKNTCALAKRTPDAPAGLCSIVCWFVRTAAPTVSVRRRASQPARLAEAAPHIPLSGKYHAPGPASNRVLRSQR